jgi:succinate dehydrogenase / fumarate reductase cytochrome b subunit
MNKNNRPLSPHLTIYRPQLTSVTSILVRITGNALIIGAIISIWWIYAAATSKEDFEFVNSIVNSWFGKLIFLGTIWALWYHTLGGIRHLIWDQGVGLEIKTAYKIGWAIIIGSFILTAFTIIIL